MKIPSPLRFVVGSALLVAPACGPDQSEPEEIPVRTNVGVEEEPTTNVGRDDTDTAAEEEGEDAPTVPEVTMEAAGPVVDPAPNPSPDTTGDPLVNPSSGERIELRPDAPYHPNKAQ
jgi:hypothetical protein